MFCKKCGKEIDDKAVMCPGCGCSIKPIKKPILKRWWFWFIIVIVIFAVAVAGGSSDDSQTNTSSENSTTISTTVKKQTYEKVDLRTMIDDLKENALKAEKTYQDKYVRINARITGFDSDGNYVSVEPVNAEQFDFTSVTCEINNDEQLNFLLEKSTGDTVVIKGQVTSVGELLGYTIVIDDVFDK
ncbi:MAG: hypothetical protein IJD90_03585 [Clostridia bacterium]|nr:hypothetical protein [Clostridia bacterium]